LIAKVRNVAIVSTKQNIKKKKKKKKGRKKKCHCSCWTGICMFGVNVAGISKLYAAWNITPGQGVQKMRFSY
jgi:hypothetical protein